MSTSPSPEAIHTALVGYEWKKYPSLPGSKNHLSAGVLVPLIWSPRPVVIATLRPRELSRHGGEICFPGGCPEPGDANACATALREAREELGIMSVELFGRLSSIPLFSSDFRLEPFVGRIPDEPLTPDPDEVARVLRFDLGEIIAGGAVEALPYKGLPSVWGGAATWQGTRHLFPIFRHGDLVMYGATALALWELIRVVAPVFGGSMPVLYEGESSWEDVVVPGIYGDFTPKTPDPEK